MIDLFVTRSNKKLQAYMYPVLVPMPWKEDAFQNSWDHLEVYTFPAFTFIRRVGY